MEPSPTSINKMVLWYKQKRLYVPEGKMRDTILKECHDGPLAGHGGVKHTTTLLKKSYYWPNLKDSAEDYVKTFNLPTKPNLQQEANRFVATFANSRRAVGKCVHGFHGKLAPIKGIRCHHGGGGSIYQDGTLHSHKGWGHGPRNLQVVLHTCLQASWSSKGHSLGSRPKVHK